MRFFLLFIVISLSLIGFSQKNQQDTYPFQKEFSKAYIQHAAVPKGILEAVAFTTTRINHIANATESCVGVPKVYGVMGLTLHGQGYFKNNLKYVSKISRISITDKAVTLKE